MDSGWAVILGALIALTGSALIPWLRESRTKAREREDQARDRKHDAIVELLAHNSALGLAYRLSDGSRIQVALEDRERASARLLLETQPEDRKPIGTLLTISIPISADDNAVWGARTNALQAVLIQWATGSMSAQDAVSHFRKTLDGSKR